MPTIVLTSGTTWRVPADCRSATIEAIGAGRGGTVNENNGGSYAKSTGVSLTPGSLAFISIPSGLFGGNTWFNTASAAAPSSATTGVKAAGGAIAPASQASNSIYTSGEGNFFRGGTGNGGETTCGPDRTAAAGGGAGPNGAGGNGGNYGSAAGAAGGGGGANGGGNGQDGGSTNSGKGGTSRLGVQGGAGGFSGSPTAGNGTNGSGGGGSYNILPSSLGPAGNGSLDPAIWTDFAGATYGVGSGGGGSYSGGVGLAGGPGGGGSGSLGQGLIVITYTSSPISIVLTSGTQWFVPPDCQTATIEAIGAGGSYDGSISSHGGSYAKSTGVALTPGSYVNIGIPAGGAGGTAWLNKANEVRYTPAQVTWSGTQFVAVDPTNNIITSPDGVVWTQKPGVLTRLTNLSAFGLRISSYNNIIVAAGRDLVSGFIRTAYLDTSGGGTSWSAGQSVTGTDLRYIYQKNGVFILSTSTGNTMNRFNSPDNGVNWFLSQSFVAGTNTPTFIADTSENKTVFADGLYVSVGGTFFTGGRGFEACLAYASTIDGGQTIVSMSNITGGVGQITGVAYGAGLWVILTGFGEYMSIYTATNLAGPWTGRYSENKYPGNVVFDGTKFIVSQSTRVLTSNASSATPGAAWTPYNAPFNRSTNALNLVVSGSETYACSQLSEGIAKTTNNGTTWTKILSGTGAPLLPTNGVVAAGGEISPTSQEINSVFTAGAGNFYRGGFDGGGFDGCGETAYGGGGGAGGPNGRGGDGGLSYYSGGGGGGANGGGDGRINPDSGGTGVGGSSRPFPPTYPSGYPGGSFGDPAGNGTNGSGGGGGATGATTGGSGSTDIIWTDFAGNTYGLGSGGGGCFRGFLSGYVGNIGLAGGPGGGGRGTLGQGIIVITYTPAPVSGTYRQVLTTSQTVYVPQGTTTLVSEAIGPGSNGGVGGQFGGGGGAYARSNTTTGFTLASAAYANVPARSTYGSTADSWLNYSANSAPTTISQGVLAKGALRQTGGTSGSSLGSVIAYSGGNGGTTQQSTRQKGGGGGAAAGPLGAGFAGGNGRPSTATGGGGGGGGTSGSGATAGLVGGASAGGNGGQSSGVPSPVPPGPAVPAAAGGAGGVTGVAAGNGTNGSGGGGGGLNAPATGLGNGGNGSTLPYWTIGGVVYGPGSGGGGGGQTGTTAAINFGGNAGTYGGGGGATGQLPSATTGGGLGGQGLLVLTYTVVAPVTPTSKVYYGATNITNIRLGSTTVNSIYYGSIKVY